MSFSVYNVSVYTARPFLRERSVLAYPAMQRREGGTANTTRSQPLGEHDTDGVPVFAGSVSDADLVRLNQTEILFVFIRHSFSPKSVLDRSLVLCV